jgi:uncharacterized protein YecT (DUF1311 family)
MEKRKLAVFNYAMTLSRCFALIFSLCVAPCLFAQKTKPIEKEELSEWIKKAHDCPPESSLYFYTLDHYDFLGDGNQEAIVVASTCMTGTAGPDIHSVFSRDSDGQIIELPIAEPKDPKTYDNLFGNRNYDLTVENGLLVETFGDDPDRDTPLIIKYKWNGKEFAVVSIEKTGVFPTSYDCTKAESEVEKAVCHVDSLAALDRDLNDIYKTLLSRLSGSELEALRSEQRAWLADRDKKCEPYKGWVGCLTDFYQQRIDALKKRLAQPSAPKPPQQP